MNLIDQKVEKVFCNKCNHETNHSMLREYSEFKTDELDSIYASLSWEIIECKGCGEKSFRATFSSDEQYDEIDGHYVTIDYFPKRLKNCILKKDYLSVPPKVRKIYSETIDSYNSNLYILCAGGLRATIEAICDSNGIMSGPVLMTNGNIRRVKTLEGKINGLVEKGILTKAHGGTLHEHRFLGNVALHQIEKPKASSLKLAIEILVHTLDNLYELEEKKDKLKNQ